MTRAQYQAESDQASVAAKNQKVCEPSTCPLRRSASARATSSPCEASSRKARPASTISSGTRQGFSAAVRSRSDHHA